MNISELCTKTSRLERELQATHDPDALAQADAHIRVALR